MDNPTTPPLIGNENDPPDDADHPYPTDESPGIVSSDKEEDNEKLKCGVHGCPANVDKYRLPETNTFRVNLPAYQLYLFTRKKYRLYICERCVTESDQMNLSKDRLKTKFKTMHIVNQRTLVSISMIRPYFINVPWFLLA